MSSEHQSDQTADVPTGSVDIDSGYETSSCGDAAKLHLPNVTEEETVCIWLKLENIVHIPKGVTDEVLSELHFILSTAALPVTTAIVCDAFKSHKLQVKE